MKYEDRFKVKPTYYISDSSLVQIFLEVYEWSKFERIQLNVPYLITKNEGIEDTIYEILHEDVWGKGNTTWYLLTDMCNRELIPEGIYVITYPASKLLFGDARIRF